MKKSKFSFLFFLFIVGVFSEGFSQQLSTTTALDSILFNKHKIVDFKSDDDVIKGLDYFFNYKKSALLVNDSLQAAYAFEMIAIGQLNLSQIQESQFNAVEALKIYDGLKNMDLNTRQAALLRINNHLGVVFRKLFDHEKAVLYYKKALGFQRDIETEISIINNISNIYKDEHKYEEAIKIIEKEYSKILGLKNRKLRATALNNLGYNQSKFKIKSGLELMLRALKIQLEEDNLSGQFSSYSNLSEYYKDASNLIIAKEYANKALSIADVLESDEYQEKALKDLIELGDYSLINKYMALTDRTKNERLLQEKKYSSMRYDFEKQEFQTQKMELEKEKEKLNRQRSQFAIVIILLFALFTFVHLKFKHKKEKLAQVYITETHIAKKLHDEVANDVYFVMTKLENNMNVSEEILDDLESIYIKTRDISKSNSAIDLNQDFSETLQDLLLSYKNDDIEIITRNISKINWSVISNLRKTTLYRVLQELMTNMKKHSKATLVAITFEQVNKKIKITYNDNGVGTTDKNVKILANAENRIKTVNGTIKFESKAMKGFKSTINI